MTFPNIPNVTPSITIRRNDVTNLLLASIAFEELGLAHLLNAEAEKLQAVLGTLPGLSLTASSISQLLSVNENINRTLRTIVKKGILLEFKLDDVLSISTETSTFTTTTQPPIFVFGNIASATGEATNTVVEAEDAAFYHSQTQPIISGYNLTETPIIGVPMIPQPSIRVIKQVSVDQGASWEDANTPNGPTLPMGAKPWFRITVLNNGNVPLHNVTVTDPSVGLISVTPIVANGAGIQWLAIPM